MLIVQPATGARLRGARCSYCSRPINALVAVILIGAGGFAGVCSRCTYPDATMLELARLAHRHGHLRCIPLLPPGQA